MSTNDLRFCTECNSTSYSRDCIKCGCSMDKINMDLLMSLSNVEMSDEISGIPMEIRPGKYKVTLEVEVDEPKDVEEITPIEWINRIIKELYIETNVYGKKYEPKLKLRYSISKEDSHE